MKGVVVQATHEGGSKAKKTTRAPRGGSCPPSGWPGGTGPWSRSPAAWGTPGTSWCRRWAQCACTAAGRGRNLIQMYGSKKLDAFKKYLNRQGEKTSERGKRQGANTRGKQRSALLDEEEESNLQHAPINSAKIRETTRLSCGAAGHLHPHVDGAVLDGLVDHLRQPVHVLVHQVGLEQHLRCLPGGFADHYEEEKIMRIKNPFNCSGNVEHPEICKRRADSSFGIRGKFLSLFKGCLAGWSFELFQGVTFMRGYHHYRFMVVVKQFKGVTR